MRKDIKLSLWDRTVIQLLALLQNVIEKFTGNANFLGAPYTIAQMEAKRLAYAEAIAAATDGGVADRALRDQLTLEVRDLLRVQANYVRNVANGDAAILASSGFPMRKTPEPVTEVGVPSRVTAHSTFRPDTVMIRWGGAAGALMFRLEKAEGDPTLGETTWTTVTQTGRQSHEVTGLIQFKAYYFRVVAIGNTAEGKPSDIVMGRAA